MRLKPKHIYTYWIRPIAPTIECLYRICVETGAASYSEWRSRDGIVRYGWRSSTDMNVGDTNKSGEDYRKFLIPLTKEEVILKYPHYSKMIT